MHPDLERLITLQRLESERDAARRAIDGMPARREDLDARLAQRAADLDAARQRGSDSGAARRVLEKDLAAVQTRLRRYKDQLMEVKTNKEYTAMQHEIAAAEEEVRKLEDLLLERLMEADELAAEVKAAEAALAAAKGETERERRALDGESARLEAAIAEATTARDRVAAEIDPPALALFETIRGRRGVAVVEARDGHCSVCHVRLRPQVYNEVRRNEAIIQCESCQRVLYFMHGATLSPPPPA